MLTVLSHQAIARLPASERTGLGEPWRRAAYRVVLHVAEGARHGPTEACHRHLATARRALDEIATIVHLAGTLQHLGDGEVAKLKAVIDECAAMICRLLRKDGSPA